MNAFTLREVADAFNVRPNAVTDWKKDGCPLDAAPYDLDAVETWCKANGKRINRVKPADDDEPDLNEQKIKADIRLKQVKTKLHRYQLAVKRGELVQVEDTEAALQDQATIFRTEILNLENAFDRFVGIETREQAKVKLRKLATDILKRLSLPATYRRGTPRRKTKTTNPQKP